MYLPILIINYEPFFSWYIAPLIWMTGVGLLFASRFTSKLYPKIGNKYYLISAIIRPIGILLIGWGWLEVIGQRKFVLNQNMIEYHGDLYLILLIISLLRPFILFMYLIFIKGQDILFQIGISHSSYRYPDSFIDGGMEEVIFWASFLFGFWAILKLGIRQSFFFRRFDDPLVTTGPFKLVRHPQLLASILMAFSSSLPYLEYSNIDQLFFSLDNAILFGLFVWLMILYEERDLKETFGETYEKYSHEVPRLFPKLMGKWTKDIFSSKKVLPFVKISLPKIKPYGKFIKDILNKPLYLYSLLLFLMAFLIMYNLTSSGKRPYKLYQGNLYEVWAAEETICDIKTFLEEKIKEKKSNQYMKYLQDDKLEKISPYKFNRNNSFTYCIGNKMYQTDINPHYLYNAKEIEAVKKYATKVCPKISGISADGFTVAAVGNIDLDPFLHVIIIKNTDIFNRGYTLANDLEENGEPIPPEELKMPEKKSKY
jgi:protein-S-isoprenylcysteine O-methyltransferase Ste14